MEKNCTIQLGYANVKIWQCQSCGVHSYTSSKVHQVSCQQDSCRGSDDAHPINMELLRHLSLVDCPGHDAYISTMINGTAVMDTAVLVVSAGEVGLNLTRASP